ncbi:hypothetical protein IFM89_015537 [Coptis chinensis]|uniref:Cupin type-1 domain-containing protein n=1 Tax=Coptis chinensis TaxID=261450 RepID=A0A835LY49_9MAGN|nr:hypothetical protein IFM89_015537 [Coptis chinensis]
MHGTIIPGCPETYQSTQQSEQQQQFQSEHEQGQQSRYRQGDQHQKVRRVRQGDIVATPAGVAKWVYNDGDTPLVMVSLFDTSNNENQLDNNRRSFYLGGNPQQQRERQQGRSAYPSWGFEQDNSSNNIFSGFDDQMLAEAFGVSRDIARKLKGQNDNRGSIVRVESGLQVIRPPRMEEEEEEYQQERPNGLEEPLCNIKLRVNIDNPSKSDVYNPNAGRINRINSRNLPILRLLNLNAEKGVLYRGDARVQIVGNYQQPIYDGELHRGQLLVVPQNFAVVKKAGDNGFEWISFQTNDNAMSSTLAGRNSALRALPQEVLMNAFRISSEEARSLKYNREETEIFAPRSESQGRAIA